MIATQEIQDRMKMTDGFDLFYRHWQAAGDARSVILCVHGGGRNSEYFEILAEGLSQEGIEVYAPDLRGLGNSVEAGLQRGDTSDFKRHLQDLDDEVSQLRQKHPGKKLFMLGHSYGGNYAVWYAAKHPDSLDGIILMGPSIVSTVKPPPAMMIKTLFAAMFAPKMMLSSGDNIWPKSVRDSEEVKFYDHNPLDTTRFSARFMMRGLVPVLNKTLKNAASVTVPTLIMNGDADIFTLTVGAQKLLDTLQSNDKTLKTFPEADHYFYHTTFPRSAQFQDDPAKRRQVTKTVSDWVLAH